MNIGRPTDYKPEYNKLVYNYCLLGATDKELSDYLEIAESTLNEWKLRYPNFSESIKAGKEDADARVAHSLHKRATGYDQKVDKVMQYQGEAVVVPTVEHVPPDTTAAMFWLKNRQSKNWRDRQEISMDIAPITFVDDLVD